MSHPTLSESCESSESDHIPQDHHKSSPSHERRGPTYFLSIPGVRATLSQDECRAPLIPSPSSLLELTMKMMETRLVK